MELTTTFQKIGSGSTKNYNGAIGHIELWAKYNSQSIENNTSNVTAELRLVVTGGYIGNYQATNWSISGDLSASGNIGSGSHYSKTLGSATADITHNNDGTKSISLSGAFQPTAWGSSYYLSVTGTADLPSIPRASSITVNDANIGSATNIVINKASSGFTTTLYYKAAGQSSFTKIVDKTANQVYGWTVPTSFYSLIPNSKTITCQFYAETYNGTILIGTSSTVTATFTATGNPVINSCSLVSTDSTTTNLVGASVMIRYISTVKATVSASPARNDGSTITSIKVNGVTAVNGVVSFTKASTYSYEVVVTDSRGYTATGTYAITWTNYIPLTINATIVRNQPTDGKIKISYNGNYFNDSFRKSDNTYIANTLTVQYRYKEKGGSFGSWTNLTPTASGNTYSQNNYVITGFDYTKQYEFEIRAVDRVTTAQIIGITVSKGEPIVYWNDSKFGLTKKLIIPKDNSEGIYSTDNKKILSNHSNNNVILNATGGTLYLGNSNTTGISFGDNNQATIDASGNITSNSVPVTTVANRFKSNNDVRDGDLNNYKNNEIHYFASNGNTNAPTAWFYALTMGNGGNDTAQFGVGVANERTYARACNSGTWRIWHELAYMTDLPSVTTGTFTITRSSGNGRITGTPTYAKYGKMVELYFEFNTSGGSVSAGADIMNGTISGIDLPKLTKTTGVGFYGSAVMTCAINSDGTFVIRTSAALSSNSDTKGISIKYICV